MKRLRAHFDEPGEVFSIFVTNQCNFLCAHCCTNSGPHETARFGLTDLDSVLEGVRLATNVRAVHVSGGEPFLALPQIELISQRCKANGTLLGVNTNGFWIRSKNICDRFDSSLSGITDLFISYSKWHAEFISQIEVGRAIRFSYDRGIRVELMLVYEKQTEIPALKQIVPEELRAHVPVSVSVVDRLGRATKMHLSPEPDANLPATYGCAEANRPVVMPDRTVLMCCNTVEYSRGTAALSLGRVTTPEDVPPLLQQHREDKGVRAIRIFGPTLLSALRRKSLSEQGGPTDTDKCSSCARLLNSKNGLQQLRESVASLPNVLRVDN